MSQDLSIFSLVLQASFVVQLVMAGLLITSLISWTVIFGKLIGLKQVRVRNDDFERDFWSGRQLGDLYQAASGKPSTHKSAPLERMKRRRPSRAAAPRGPATFSTYLRRTGER